MRSSPKFTLFVFSFVLVFGLATRSFAQQPKPDPAAAAAVVNGQAGYNFTVKPVNVNQVQPIQLTVGSGTVFDAVTGAVVGASSGQSSASANSSRRSNSDGNDDDLVNGDVRHTPKGGTIDGLDTVATFGGAFAAQAGPDQGNVFKFTMMGNHPSTSSHWCCSMPTAAH